METFFFILGLVILFYYIFKKYSSGGPKSRVVPSSKYDLSIDDCESLPDRFIVADIETTGLDAYRDSIIEIAAIKVVKGQSKYESKTALIDPGTTIPKKITSITGIDNKMVRGKKRIEKVIVEFLDFSEDLPLVFYNANFDMEFLRRAALDAEQVIANKVIDALYEARMAQLDVENYKLGTVARHFNIRIAGSHRALNDCITTLQVFKKVRQSIGEQICAAETPNQNVVDEHFRLEGLVSETYSRRKVPAFRQKCIESCTKHIDMLDSKMPILKTEIRRLKHISTYQYFATILTEDGEYDKAIEVCEKAISHGLHDNTKTGFKGRISRIKRKKGKRPPLPFKEKK